MQILEIIETLIGQEDASTVLPIEEGVHWKPIDLSQFMRVVRSVEDFWLTIVKLPNGER